MRYANENVLNRIEQSARIALRSKHGNIVKRQFGVLLFGNRCILNKQYISQLVSQRHPPPIFYALRMVQTFQ